MFYNRGTWEECPPPSYTCKCHPLRKDLEVQVYLQKSIKEMSFKKNHSWRSRPFLGFKSPKLKCPEVKLCIHMPIMHLRIKLLKISERFFFFSSGHMYPEHTAVNLIAALVVIQQEMLLKWNFTVAGSYLRLHCSCPQCVIWTEANSGPGRLCQTLWPQQSPRGIPSLSSKQPTY